MKKKEKKELDISSACNKILKNFGDLESMDRKELCALLGFMTRKYVESKLDPVKITPNNKLGLTDVMIYLRHELVNTKFAYGDAKNMNRSPERIQELKDRLEHIKGMKRRMIDLCYELGYEPVYEIVGHAEVTNFRLDPFWKTGEMVNLLQFQSKDEKSKK